MAVRIVCYAVGIKGIAPVPGQAEQFGTCAPSALRGMTGRKKQEAIMQTGQIIRKYRKLQNMTQEDMAERLGVSAPAVNKWENGNSMPDIMLLKPIARLLDISLDELLSYEKELTDPEVNELMRILNKKMESKEYAEVFRWAKHKMEQYPNCEHLHLWMCISLEGGRIIKEAEDMEQYDDFLRASLERLLKSGEEYVRTTAADCLYNFCVRKERYEEAEKYLDFLSTQNPERKRKQAFLYAREGRNEEAFRLYEELLFSGYQIFSAVLYSMLSMVLQEKDMDKAEYLSEKMVQLVRFFEMGTYQEYAARLEFAQAKEDVRATIACAEKMLESADQVGNYRNVRLYEHMSFRDVSDDFKIGMREKLIQCFREDESFGYMKGNAEWTKLIG